MRVSREQPAWLEMQVSREQPASQEMQVSRAELEESVPREGLIRPVKARLCPSEPDSRFARPNAPPLR